LSRPDPYLRRARKYGENAFEKTMVERSPDHREIEIKLEIERRAASSLRGEIASLSASVKTAQIVSRYYDTKDHTLRKFGFTSRVRKIDEGLVQTIKAEGGSSAGLYDREEWETELDTEDLDYAAIARSGLEQKVDMQVLVDKLEPIFETHIERTSWRMFLDDSDIEVALDEGLVKAGATASEITELELELKSGSLTTLFALARQLGMSAHAQIGVMTKAERGYALLDGSERPAIKAEAVLISPGLSAAQAFKIMAAFLRSTIQAEPAADRAGRRRRSLAPGEGRNPASAIALFGLQEDGGRQGCQGHQGSVEERVSRTWPSPQC
jgi:triphosphatase